MSNFNQIHIDGSYPELHKDKALWASFAELGDIMAEEEALEEEAMKKFNVKRIIDLPPEGRAWLDDQLRAAGWEFLGDEKHE